MGGSGVYEIEGMKTLKEFYPATPFGKPSDPITIGEYQGIRCAFLPRHGRGHRFLPGEIPQRANFFALKMLEVEYVIALSACGSLKQELAPRHFVVPDQIVDRTKGRVSTFFGDGIVAHISFAHPFSPSLSKLLADTARELGVTVHEKGTYVCMEGPAFSTKAESEFHRKMGFDVIGMTAIPEAKLAREAEMSYALLAMVTDYDCWKEEDEVSVELVVQNLMANAENAKKVVARALPRLSQIPNENADALKGAIFTQPDFIKPSTKKKLWPLIKKYVN
ncbi:MAG: S-methyl-5'-thioadenosine phosphorylase [Elusimicrobia bacterium]|nr:S-methyl-5'-thioadenosine phosphorylase [Candidatus Obscuribacterium magneticum]